MHSTNINTIIGTQKSEDKTDYSNTTDRYKYLLCPYTNGNDMKAYNFDKKKLEELYHSGKTLREIGDMLNCSPDTIYDYFVKYKIPRRKASRTSVLLFQKTSTLFIQNLNPFW